MKTFFKNRLKIVGSSADARAVKKFLQGTNNTNEILPIDFAKIIPMPSKLEVEADSNAKLIHYLLFGDPDGINMISLVDAREKIKELGVEEKMNAFDLALFYEENKKVYGHFSAITWKKENWKVDSNALNVKFDTETEIEFETQNESVLYLIAELAKKFPKIKFEYKWELSFHKYSSVFENGKLIEIVETNSIFNETNKLMDLDSYYNN